jgi:N-6 DNA Methylase
LSEIVDRLKAFVEYAEPLSDEKGEAQVFCDRLFQAFGHPGYKEAGATLEARVPKKGSKGKKFIDLIWKPRLLMEMKSASENLTLAYQQAFDYWIASVPNRPRYVVLCNFKEFWVYDFDKQLDQPVDKVALGELPHRYTALNFLFPNNPKPIFQNDREGVSREAADKMAALFRSLVLRSGKPVKREQAQRFVLQLLVAMFAEDIDLLPSATIKSIVDDCLKHDQASYDLFGGLFRQMDEPIPAKAGRYKGVRYFNGGLFSKVEPIELMPFELELIGQDDSGAALKDWSKVNPAIFGTLFQDSMDEAERHAFGAHYTAEADIQRIVGPTIVRPWTEQIDAASSMKQLLELRSQLSKFKVLDPACGSGNFLYVAYREMAHLDLRILQRIKEAVSPKEFQKQVKSLNVVSPKQFHGIDLDGFGVELAKVTLMLAKKLAMDDAREAIGSTQGELALHEEALPLDNLDGNFVRDDALFVSWPTVDAIIGNPPYQSKNKRQGELEPGYENKLRAGFPDVDGRADYCTYWFRRAHDSLKPGQRAGLVGTNTIRQNYSREASLDYIVNNGGTITEAVSSMVWPGDAVVHVSIVDWIKGDAPGMKRLFFQDGNKAGIGQRVTEVPRIGPSLSLGADVTKAQSLKVNRKAACYQGQTHGHKAFLINAAEAKAMLWKDKTGQLAKVLHPFLIANELVGKRQPKPQRYVIDFRGLSLLEAEEFSEIFGRIKKNVLPAREKAAKKEAERNQQVLKKDPKATVNRHHENFLKSWWQLSYGREEMIIALEKLPRYIVCGQVTKRPIFAFVSTEVRPNAALQVFAYEDDYTFGILQSDIHWRWFAARCSTMKSDPRYTSNTVWDSFPWPQQPSETAVNLVAEKAVSLRTTRDQLALKHNLSLRDLYRSLELPGKSPLKDAQSALDEAVRAAYGMIQEADTLGFLLDLNGQLAAAEEKGEHVRSAGLPEFITDRASFITSDSLTA